MGAEAESRKGEFDEALADVEVARHRRFVIEWLDCRNKTESARRCGYSGRSARVTGHRIFARPDVQRAIEAGLAWMRADSGVVVEEIDLGLIDRALNKIANDPGEKTADRLKAMNMLIRRNGGYQDGKDEPPPRAAIHIETVVVGPRRDVRMIRDERGFEVPEILDVDPVTGESLD